MQPEEDICWPEVASCSTTPEILQKSPRDSGSRRRGITSAEVKRIVHHSPHNSPGKYLWTPQSSGSRGDPKAQTNSGKRKIQSSHNESLKKIQKTRQSGKFLNSLIALWSKHMGDTPVPHAGRSRENPMAEEMKHMYSIEERTIQKLQKKLQAAEETVSTLSNSNETELRAKEEILQQLNSDWESITNYYDGISESLKGFQRHKDNLKTLYNDVIVKQQSTVKNLQQELSTMKLKDEEHESIVTTLENQVIYQEERMQEMMTAMNELKKQLEDIQSKLVLEKNRLHDAHAEEKKELMKKEENLTLMNRELQVQLQKITEEKQNINDMFAGKDSEITKLQEEIVTYKDKIEHLLCQSAELSTKYEKSIEREGETEKELQSRAEEIAKLRENLNARQEIESSLAKDLDMIDNKYKNVQSDLTSVEKKLKEAQARNLHLENSLDDIKFNNEQKINELSARIELLEREKERIISDKRSDIQKFEKARKLLKERREAEIKSLKKEFDVKLKEMKRTIYRQKADIMKLNEALKKTNKENQNAPIRELKGQQLQNQENVHTAKNVSIDKSEMSKPQPDIYSFNTLEENNLQNILSPTKQNTRVRFDMNTPTKVPDYSENHSYLFQDPTQLNVQTEERQEMNNEKKNSSTPKKKVFKTSSTGLRQYGTHRGKFFNK